MNMKFMNQYLKDGKAKGMENTFYIIQCPYTSQEWWQLLLRETHQVVRMNMKFMNQYLKDGKAKGMENTFYIIQCPYTSQEWWQLLLRETHQVVSTSPTKAGILENVQMMVKKYKTSDNVIKAMSKTDYQLNPNTIEQRKELYKVYECLIPESSNVRNYTRCMNV